MPDRFKWGTTLIALGAGLLIGFAASTFAYRYRLLHVPGGTLIDRIDRDLKLTPAQRRQVADIMHDTRFKMQELRHEFHRRRQQLFWQAYDQIHSILTPDQQEKFDQDFAPPGLARHRRTPPGQQ